MNEKEKVLAQEYESKIGKKAIVDERETIGFKRWKQRNLKDTNIEKGLKKCINQYSNELQRDFKEIIKIYLKKKNIKYSDKMVFRSLNNIHNRYLRDYIYYDSRKVLLIGDKLNLRFKGLSDFSEVEGLFQSKKVRILNLANNDLDTLPKKIKNLKKVLKSLDISWNSFKEFPSQLKYFKHLKVLNLENNKISSIPSYIKDLQNLEELDLETNYISSLPKEIGSLRELKTLDLRHNDLKKLPSSIGKLHSLRTFLLDDNNLSSLPKAIKNCLNLKQLNIQMNHLNNITPLEDLHNLKILLLSTNNIETLPDSIDNLSSIEHLNLSDNNISTLPKSIGNLNNLEVLNLFDNPILPKDLPSKLKEKEKIGLIDIHIDKLY